MISERIKSRLFPRLIRQALKVKQEPTVSGRRSLGLITDLSEEDARNKLASIHIAAGFKDNFQLVVCRSREKEPDDTKLAILDKKEIGLGGKFESQQIQEFLEEEFDFLLCYFSESSPEGNLLAAKSRASVRIGNSPDEFGVFDLVIEANSVEVFQQETLKYIEILKKNTK